MKCFVRRKKSEKNIIESRNNFPTLAAAHLSAAVIFLAQTLLFFMDGKFLVSSSALSTTIEIR